jgi:type IV fimbrial biogenesis protein FimT
VLTPGRQRGMSIVEIVVALAILAMLIALVGPSAGAWIQNTQLRNAADSVVAGVQSARLEALKRNRSVMFQLLSDTSTAWQICIYDPVLDACSAAADAIIAEKSASEASTNAVVAVSTVAAPNPLIPLPVTPPSGYTPAKGSGTFPASVTFDSFGRVNTTAASNLTLIDVRNPTLTAANERRLVILVGIGGQIRMCDPKLNKADNPQGCV